MIALTDQGRIPEADECLPWKRYSQYDGRIIGELPIIPYNHAVGSTLRERRPHKASGSAASVSHDPSASNAAAGPSSGRPVEGEASIAEAQHQHDISAPQPAVPVVEAALPLPLRRVSLLSAAEHSQLVADPFFLVASLVTTSALSWSQLLNVIVDRLAVARMQRAMYAGEDDDGSSTPDLVYAGVAATKGPRNRRRASAGRMEEGKSERVGGGGGEGADETRRRTSRTNIKVDHARQRPTMRQQLENLQYHIGILQRVQAAIDSNLELVRRGGLCDTWAADIISDSHNDNDEETDTTADAASTAATGKAAAILKRRRPLQARLTRDLESLSRRCAAAVRECESGMAALMSLGQLVSAEGARAEAREVTRLTYVAFVFVPCTWAASVFQMDLDAWRDRDRAVSFAAAAVVALLFLALVFSGLLDLAGERMRRLWVAVRKRARWWWMWG